MKSDQEQKLGMNMTGVMMSPMGSSRTAEGAKNLTTPPSGSAEAIGANRVSYMNESGPVGTLPTPATPKGMFKGLKEKFTKGNYTFIDKLGERIAFERTGTRLWQALLSKHHGTEDKANLPPLEVLERFTNEEYLHFVMLCDVMVELGGDPTAITPMADVSGTAALGWVNAITDPRTSFFQSLHVIHMAELVDNDGWDMLIKLAEDAGEKKIVESFRKAKSEEDEHLETVRVWMSEGLLKGSVETLSLHQ